MTNKCAACGKFVSQNVSVKCPGCDSLNHFKCVRLEVNTEIDTTWRCPECKMKLPKIIKNANTPVTPLLARTEPRPSPALAASEVVSAPPAGDGPHTRSTCVSTVETESSINGDDLLLEIRRFREELRDTRLEMAEFRLAVAGLTAGVATCNNRLDGIETRIQGLERQMTEKTESGAAALEATIAQLKLEISNRDQEVLSNDVEISGILEGKEESLTHIVLSVAKKLDVQLHECDVVSAVRMGPARAPAEGEGAPRPRPIAVRLTRRAIRDALLRAARVRRHATTAGMGLPGAAGRFYVNERLSRDNRLLFNKVREAASRSKWRFVWTRDGRVYARKQDGAEGHRLRSQSDISRVFGERSVSDN